jgi:prepilin-type N-terminal cleavage/methylation domain-containing protein
MRPPLHSSTFRRRTARGFNLIELSMTLVVMGVLGLLAVFAFSGADRGSSLRGRAEADGAREAVRYFVLINKRLPCPDNDGDGREDCGTVEFGFLPYLTLGLDEAAGERMRYAVYRGSANDATSLVERTGDTEGQPDYLGIGDTIAALKAIPVTSNSAAHVRVAALDANGASNCNNATHPAFVLVVPNADRDGDGSRLDGVNAGTATCVASPLQFGTPVYDDIVVAEAADALIGWLFKQHVH